MVESLHARVRAERLEGFESLHGYHCPEAFDECVTVNIEYWAYFYYPRASMRRIKCKRTAAPCVLVLARQTRAALESPAGGSVAPGKDGIGKREGKKE